MSASFDVGKMRKSGLDTILGIEPWVSVGMGTCGLGNGAAEVFEALRRSISDLNLKAKARKVGCFGFCAAEPMVMAWRPGKPVLVFSDVRPAQAPRIAQGLKDDATYEKLAHLAEAKIETWDFRTNSLHFGQGFPFLPSWKDLAFFKGQEKLVLRDCGMIDPERIEEYLAAGGYSGLIKALTTMTPDAVITEVQASGLRGRGGAGFPTWKKWRIMRDNVLASPGEAFAICNADEGDPGAYMNRNEIESDPHMLIEGMVIGAYAMGANKGIIYVRAEYPLAVERLEKAIAQARKAGMLGANILGSKFSFDLEIVTGAGAFVCGEETALIASIEGKAGRPSPRPPFPAQKGLHGRPTTINNVETWCNLPIIIARGSSYFSSYGTPTSTGTKVFSFVGKVRNTGLVELPMGSSLESAVYGMCEGMGPKKKIKGLQSGGPSGGCIPASLFKTPIDYEHLAELGAIMGSGGMVVMDQDNCMVDVARYFIGFTAGESCGKCTACREGTSQMLNILQGVADGQASEADLKTLENLALSIKDSALCGLGQTSANPVLTTLRYFKDEYIQHIKAKRCPAGICENLYVALCESSCPLHMNIPGYLQLLKENRIEDAFELTLRENPLPGSLGRICHFHCRMRCRRDMLDEPVSQGEIHRYLADSMYKMGREKTIYNRLIKEKLPPTGKKISIVGAGPAGLAAAFWLSRLGHEVTVYEGTTEAGGILRWGIPAYRLPKDVLRKEISFIQKLGARFVYQTKIQTKDQWKRLADASDAIIVAVGAEREIGLGIPGEEMAGVIHAGDFLRRISENQKPKIGSEAIVVGGGNSAIDAARSALRLGARVTVVYRRARSDMPANAEELAGALDEGVQVLCMTRPVEVLPAKGGKGCGALRVQRMKAGPVDSSGRPTPMPTDEIYEISCDSIIVAVGEKVGIEGIEALAVISEKDGRLKVDPYSLRTSNPKLFACGDAVTGPATAAEAMGQARIVSESVDEALMGAKRFKSLFRSFEYKMEVPTKLTKAKMTKATFIPVDARRSNFMEISLGYTGEQARIEAERCLRCDVRDRKRETYSAPVED
ncbi:MAG TPA: FAD-dependent oxidoreductase [Rectinemataceae bacterium]